MPVTKLSKELFDNLSYDRNEDNMLTEPSSQETGTNSPTVMVVFDTSDLNAAVFHQIESVKSPFAKNAITTLFLQESISEVFIDKLNHKLQSYEPNIPQNPIHKKTLDMVQRLNLRTIPTDGRMPIFVCDITHDKLGSTQPAGIVTLHVFRTAKEAIKLCGQEGLQFANATIWQDNFSCSYELVSQLAISNFYLNCNNVPLTPVGAAIAEGKSFATIERNYHYEVLQQGERQKTIVFPIGTIFAN